MKIRISVGRIIFQIVNHTVLVALALSALLPFLYVIAVSLVDPADYAVTGVIFPPRSLSLYNYIVMLGPGSRLFGAYGVTLFITVVGTAISLLLTSGVAYALSKKDLPLRRTLTLMIFFTMIFSGGLIPTFLVVRNTGLMNTVWSVIIPGAVVPWYMFIMRNYFMSIPSSIEESAKIDGANDIFIMFRIIWPISMPVLACVGLFYATDRWNEWFFAMLYINDPSIFPIQLVLRNIISMTTMHALDPGAMSDRFGVMPPSDLIQSTAIIIAILPIMFVYPFVQRYFAQGIMIGAIKG